MNTYITTIDELKKYEGKLIVTHYEHPKFGYTHSLRILTNIVSKDRDSLLGCKIYGKYILKIDKHGSIEDYFTSRENPMYASDVDYARLPTIEEKHMFMEKYTKVLLKK